MKQQADVWAKHCHRKHAVPVCRPALHGQRWDFGTAQLVVPCSPPSQIGVRKNGVCLPHRPLLFFPPSTRRAVALSVARNERPLLPSRHLTLLDALSCLKVQQDERRKRVGIGLKDHAHAQGRMKYSPEHYGSDYKGKVRQTNIPFCPFFGCCWGISSPSWENN